MTPKQQRFVVEYLKDLNATQAAIRSGYSEKTAKQIGSRLLTNVDIGAAIAKAQTKVASRLEIDAAYVVANAVEVVERCMQRAPVMVRGPLPGTWVQQVDEDGNHVWQFDAKNTIGGLTLLAKHLGMFIERHEHEIHDLSAEDRETRVREILLLAKQRKMGQLPA